MRSSIAPSFVAALFCAAVMTATLSVPHAAASPGCPRDTILCDGFSSVSTEGSASCSLSPSDHPTSYDLTGGLLQAFAPGASSPWGIGASDVYTIDGVDPDAPLSFEALLTVHASAEIGSCLYFYPFDTHCTASLTDVGSGAFRGVEAMAPFNGCGPGPLSCCWGSATVDTVLALPLTYPAGDGFRLAYDLIASVNGLGTAGVTATIGFRGLPPGALITSCQGYVQTDFPTAMRKTTWGALKSRYR